MSIRPPQHTIAGQVSLFIPSTWCRRIVAVFPTATGASIVPTISAGIWTNPSDLTACASQSNPSSEYVSPD